MSNFIDFIDLVSGKPFSGERPYIFWFPKGQGINLIYSMPICFVCNLEKIQIKNKSNPIFKLVDNSKIITKSLENINGVQYYDLTNLISTRIESTGERISDGNYIHLFHIIAQSEIAGEFIDEFEIGDFTFQVGADFYSENESLYVNLANNGLDIPKEIQKALYPANVHEDKIDNILLNRKWKELLSNYWDTVSNKGSYKSLINSLNWFEYGDLLQIYEVWKHYESDREILDLRSLQEVLSNKYFETLNGFAKTSYISIQLALDKIAVDSKGNPLFDSYGNPLLKKLVNKWSYKDLSLKLSMLGNFYETYFMPIHLNLIHCTIENIVYTAPLIFTTGAMFNKYTYDFQIHKPGCNIKTGDTFSLKPVHAEAGDNTIFNKHKINNISDYNVLPVGVEPAANLDIKKDDSIKHFYAQYFNDIGAIIPFDMQLFNLSANGVKIKGILDIDGEILIDENIKINQNIKFNILLTEEKEYEIKLEFDILDANNNIVQTYINDPIKINIIDDTNISLMLYKIQHLEENELTTEFWKGKSNLQDKEMQLDYILGRQTEIPVNNTLYAQYIPASMDLTDWDGAMLNNVLVVENTENEVSSLQKDYFIFPIKTGYCGCISKKFGYIPTEESLKCLNVYINKFSFIPYFHKLVPLDIQQEFKVSDKDTLCVVPFREENGKLVKFEYGKPLNVVEWEFINTSKLNQEPIKIEKTTNIPLVAPTTNKVLESGYYDIIFKYKISNNIKQSVLRGAFYKI